MPRKIPLLVWLAVPLAYLLYFYGLGSTGVLGPDEPRYASVGREMARSGDWITPRLWGEPWFEKPALLYWMTSAAFRAGVGPDLAPRLPVALLAVGFLAFLWWILNREYNGRVAWLGVLILGTTVGWQGMGQAGVADLPLAATFGGAMLLALPWVARDDTRYLPAAAALLGLAVLAKGPLPMVLALPVALRGRRLRDLARIRVIVPFLAVSVPWYLLCYLKNGNVFLQVFFVRHNFQRFTSSQTILHGQPWWYYLPVLLAGLIPWAPLVALPARRATVRDPRKAFLLAWVVWGLAFFSIAANKLPAYILPLLPACAVLMALGVGRTGRRAAMAGRLRPVAGGLPPGRPAAGKRPGDGIIAGHPAGIRHRLPGAVGSRRGGVVPGIPGTPSGGSRLPGRRRGSRRGVREGLRGAGAGTDAVAARALAAGGPACGRCLPGPCESKLGIWAELLCRSGFAGVFRAPRALAGQAGSGPTSPVGAARTPARGCPIRHASARQG